MGKVRTPLLSFGASGKLANTLVYFSWKGLDVVREYVIPSNPKTAAQTTQRNLFSAMVASWRNYFTDSGMRADWNRSASASHTAQSGFNSAMSAMIKICSGDPDASFASASAPAAGNTVDFTLLNADDGAQGDEAGDFEVWVGDHATSLLNFETVAIAVGVVSTSDLGDADDVKYVKLRKDGQDRSGISKVTLIA